MFYNARMYDPALGRFTSADSIIPGGAQGLDRYAYVNNSPVNFTDPSGHEPYERCGGKASCTGYINEKPNNNSAKADDGGPEYYDKPDWKWIGSYHDCTLTYKECFYDWGLGILILHENQQIDQSQFDELLMAVYFDLKSEDGGILPLLPWKWDLARRTYDTPFWNPDYGKFLDPNTQTYIPIRRDDVRVCFGQDCYKRSDINYFAQGMWGAISGETLEDTISLAADYKQGQYKEELTSDTEFWITFGYNKVLEYDKINLMDTLKSP